MAKATDEGTSDTFVTVVHDRFNGRADSAQAKIHVIETFDTIELSDEMWPDRPSRAEFLGTRLPGCEASDGVGM